MWFNLNANGVFVLSDTKPLATMNSAIPGRSASARRWTSHLLSLSSTRTCLTRGRILCTNPLVAAALARRETSSTASQKSNTSNVFLDNLGTIFLTGIGLVIVSLTRSYYGSVNRNKIRHRLEEVSVLDPLEIDDLRTANSGALTTEMFRLCVHNLATHIRESRQLETGDIAMLYEDFVWVVRKTLMKKHGPLCTVEFGHLMDRVVLNKLSSAKNFSSDKPLPFAFLCTLLSLAHDAPGKHLYDPCGYCYENISS
jgi:hypothetical protein